MDKRSLLEYLDRAGVTDADKIAHTMGVTYGVVAMGLLRLVRQGLATRDLDVGQRRYVYQISPRGRERLAYFSQRPREARRARDGHEAEGPGA